MSETSSELWSMATTVEELTARLRAVAVAYEASRRDDLVSEVHEVERALTTAIRRLNRLAATQGA